MEPAVLAGEDRDAKLRDAHGSDVFKGGLNIEISCHVLCCCSWTRDAKRYNRLCGAEIMDTWLLHGSS